MFNELVFEIFKIDKMKNRWPVRILFILMVIMNSSIRFLPEEYSDFSEFFDWMEVFSAASYDERMKMYMNDMPITNENIIYIAIAFIIVFLNIMGLILYSGIFVREYRKMFVQPGKEKKVLAPISVSRLIGRYILVLLWMSVIAFPLYFVCFYLFFIVIFIVPYLMIIPVGYLSGDYEFFETVGKTIKNMRGHYLLTSRYLSIIIIAYVVISLLVSGIMAISPTCFYIVDAFVLVWILMSVARLSVIAYTDMVVKA